MTKLLLLIPFLLPSYGFSQQMDNSGDEIFTHSQTVSYMHGYKGRDVLSKPTRIKNYTWKGSVLYLVEEIDLSSDQRINKRTVDFMGEIGQIGKNTFWYDNGNKEKEYFLKVTNIWQNNSYFEESGKYTEWYNTGQTSVSGNYENGLMEGEWRYYFENGKLKAEVLFIKGDGENVSEISGVPLNGRNEKWIFYNDNGKKSAVAKYKNGKFDGVTRRWYETGKKQYEGTVMDTIYIGVHINWSPDGKDQSKIDYGNGVGGNGLFKRWYENGNKKVEGNLKNGFEDGLWVNWYESGSKKQEVTWKNGNGHGLSIGWHENGQKEKEGNYVEGKPDGFWVWWNINGQKKQEGNYKDSHQVGKWSYWNSDGTLDEEIEYK